MDRHCFNTLVVEDDEDQLELLEDEIKDYFENDSQSKYKFEIIIATTAEEAIQKLNSHIIDCAIVDLRLPKNKSSTNTYAELGNNILELIYSMHAIPIVVISSVPSEASDEINDSPVLCLERESSSYNKALKWLIKNAELMLLIQAAQNNIKGETARLFHSSIWPRWERRNLNPDMLPEKAIIRQIVCHLAEHLTITDSTDRAKFIPDEFYLDPPIREALHTGDLIHYDGNIYVIVTPQCNMANEKLNHILMAECKDERSTWESIINNIDGSSNKRKSADAKIKKLISQGHEISSHFLPPCGDRGPWLVEFKNIISTNQKQQLLKGRFASIAPLFIPNLTQRFAAYIGRPGQPDLDKEELVEYMKTLIYE